ncbi:hypothetical protein IM40_02405 [Candidatus Paracaedimonas acanthamoebae]|nr:hypothetical protein IM40_02405 [Candidatus Paracaedimonas acanthamoebae]
MTIAISELSNGIRLGLRESRDAKQVVLCFAIGAGTACENEQLNGIAHMVTHMNILGSLKRSGWDISTEVEATGAEIQFFVHPEKTEYYLHLPFSKVEKGIEIMADCLLNATFPEEALNREKTVIEQEIVERHDNPFVLASDLFNEASFPNQGYGFCPLGTKESMYNLSLDALKNYKQEYFYPKNFAIAAYGNIGMDYLLKCVDRFFGKASNGAKTTYPIRIKPQFINGHKYLCRPQRNELAHAFMGFPLSENISENVTAYIIAKILGSGTSSRFFQELRQKRALGYTMASKVDSFGGMGLLRFYFSGWKKTQEHDLLGEACKLINKFPYNITEKEVNAGKNKVIHEMELAIDNPFSSVGMLAEQLLYGGDPNQMEDYVNAIRSISFPDVVNGARAILTREPSISFVGSYDAPPYNVLTSILHEKVKEGMVAA